MKINASVGVVAALAIAAVTGYLSRGVTAQPAPTTTAQPARIAVVDVMTLMKKLMESDSFAAPQKQMQADMQKKVQELKDMLDAIEKKITDEKDEAAKAKLNEEKSAKQMDAQQRYQALQADNERFSINQIGDAYKLVTETANRMAHDRGYTHVLMSRAGELPRDQGSQVIFQEIVLRSVVSLPKGDDLTDAVTKELKLDQPPAPPAPPAPAGTGDAPVPAPKPVAPPK